MSNLISVITINLNNALGLKKTINSVFSQDYSNIEYIIIDGDSNDGSLEIIQSVSSKLAYFISEKDEGIYSAMNKGIVKANGEYLIFLNSGDYFASPSSISSLKMNALSKSIIYGNMLIEQNGELSIEKYPHRVDLNFFLGGALPHPSTLINRNLFLKFGLYKTNYRIISDWAFFVDTIISNKVSYEYVDTIVSVFNLNGISSQPSNYKIIRDEMNAHFKSNYFLFYLNYRIRWAINYYPKRALEKALMYLGFSK